jgi:hypothetical protein
MAELIYRASRYFDPGNDVPASEYGEVRRTACLRVLNVFRDAEEAWTRRLNALGNRRYVVQGQNVHHVANAMLRVWKVHLSEVEKWLDPAYMCDCGRAYVQESGRCFFCTGRAYVRESGRTRRRRARASQRLQ